MIDFEHQVQEMLLLDRVFIEYGVEKEDFNLAIDKHGLESDEMIQETHNAISNSVAPALAEKITTSWFPNQQGCEQAEEEPNSASFDQTDH